MLGNQVALLSTLERRLELLAELGVEETLVVEFTPEVASLEPEEFARSYLAAIGAELVVAGEVVPLRPRAAAAISRCSNGSASRPARRRTSTGVSSTRIRAARCRGRRRAARGAARPAGRGRGHGRHRGEARGGTLGFPTANLRTEPTLLVPGYGIYAGAALGHRAAISIGVNPHYGGAERKIEVFLLDFDGDLYGQRLVVEVWERLRDEAAFESEDELIAQIARDVAATRAATRP